MLPLLDGGCYNKGVWTSVSVRVWDGTNNTVALDQHNLFYPLWFRAIEPNIATMQYCHISLDYLPRALSPQEGAVVKLICGHVSFLRNSSCKLLLSHE